MLMTETRVEHFTVQIVCVGAGLYQWSNIIKRVLRWQRTWPSWTDCCLKRPSNHSYTVLVSSSATSSIIVKGTVLLMSSHIRLGIPAAAPSVCYFAPHMWSLVPPHRVGKCFSDSAFLNESCTRIVILWYQRENNDDEGECWIHVGCIGC